jgi:archaellum component FlaG (FlaF/FlaG flagellin family)
MKKIILAFIALAYCTAIHAQNYKRVFYKNQTIENKDIRIIIDDAVATDAGVKFKMKIKNLTNDYIIYKPSESAFKIDGKTVNPTEKWLIIPPNDDESRVIDLKGPNYKKAADFEFILDGVYKASANAKGVAAPDFKLPASQNEFKAGEFTVTLEKAKKETARTDAKFNVKYTGSKIAIFEPNKVTMKMPDGKEYANYHADRKAQLLNSGDVSFTVAWKDIPKTSGDMQFAEMIILWRDAFKETAPVKLEVQTITIAFDKDLTEVKGK